MDTIRIPLMHDAGYALIDAADLDLITDRHWSLYENHRNGWKSKHYAVASINKRAVYMHQIIMGALGVDHKNGDGLDNRHVNLRIATVSQNGANSGPRGGTSPFKGVLWHKNAEKWQAYIQVNYLRRHLGYFDDEMEAAQAYDAAAREAWGEFAYLNFPGY